MGDNPARSASIVRRLADRSIRMSCISCLCSPSSSTYRRFAVSMPSTLRSCLRATSTCVSAYALALRHLRLTRSSSLVQLFRVQLVVAWFGLQPRDAPVGVHVAQRPESTKQFVE